MPAARKGEVGGPHEAHLVRVRVRFRVRVRVRVRVTTSWWPSAAAYLEEMWRRYAGDMGEMWGGHVVVANKVGQ